MCIKFLIKVILIKEALPFFRRPWERNLLPIFPKKGSLCNSITERIKKYTGCPRRNVPDFGRVFLVLKYTDMTQNTYVQSCGYGDNGQRSLKL